MKPTSISERFMRMTRKKALTSDRHSAASVAPNLLVILLIAICVAGVCKQVIAAPRQSAPRDAKIEPIDPPESDFFTKQLSFHGILIKAPTVVDDAAMYALYDRMATETANLPLAVVNLAAAGAEIHII